MASKRSKAKRARSAGRKTRRSPAKARKAKRRASSRKAPRRAAAKKPRSKRALGKGRANAKRRKTARRKRSNQPEISPEAAAAFSSKVLREMKQEAPQVQTWGQAKGESKAPPAFINGATQPALPKGLSPLAGEVAVPKPKMADVYMVSPPRGTRGRRSKVHTAQDFGPVQLRQATASGGRQIAKAKPENLKRAASRFQPLVPTTTAAQKRQEAAKKRKAAKKKRKAKPARSGRKPAKGKRRKPTRGARPQGVPNVAPERVALHIQGITDLGEIEVHQQSRQGRRRVGRLDGDAPQ